MMADLLRTRPGASQPVYDLEPALPVTDEELRELKACEDRINKKLSGIGEDLLTIRDKRLYRASHGTFEAYCEAKWGRTARWARQVCAGALVMRNLRGSEPLAITEGDKARPHPGPLPQEREGSSANGNHGAALPTNERQLRPLTRLEPEEQKPIWEEARRTAPNGEVTGKHIEETIAKKGKKWPEAREGGTFDTKLAKYEEFPKTKAVAARLYFLQIGEEQWTACPVLQYYQGDCRGSSGQLRRSSFKTKEAALAEAARDLLSRNGRMDQKSNSCITLGQIETAKKLDAWAKTFVLPSGDGEDGEDPEEEEKPKVVARTPSYNSGVARYDLQDRAIDLRAGLVALDSDLARLQEEPVAVAVQTSALREQLKTDQDRILCRLEELNDEIYFLKRQLKAVDTLLEEMPT